MPLKDVPEFRTMVPGIFGGPLKTYDIRIGRQTLHVTASSGDLWEHVGISLQHRTPTWGEMEAIKQMFWDPEDTVVQYHPAKSEYVNFHPYCLHLWRPLCGEILRPPAELVGGG